MDLGWGQNILYGLFAGAAEILPVSARAHSILLLKIFGAGNTSQLAMLFIHFSILAALYYCNQNQIVRVSRALALSRIPKKRRKRPLDTKSLMDFSVWRTMLIPIIICVFLYRKTSALEGKLLWTALFLFLNGIILYIPQFLPSGNKDSRTLSRLDGLLMGLGEALSIFPGISGIGASVSIGSIRGADRTYSLNLSLLAGGAVILGFIAYDILAILSVGIGEISFIILIKYIVSAAASFVGAVLAIKTMRQLAANSGFFLFAYYCWGLALFTFILNLIA